MGSISSATTPPWRSAREEWSTRRTGLSSTTCARTWESRRQAMWSRPVASWRSWAPTHCGMPGSQTTGPLEDTWSLEERSSTHIPLQHVINSISSHWHVCISDWCIATILLDYSLRMVWSMLFPWGYSRSCCSLLINKLVLSLWEILFWRTLASWLRKDISQIVSFHLLIFQWEIVKCMPIGDMILVTMTMMMIFL